MVKKAPFRFISRLIIFLIIAAVDFSAQLAVGGEEKTDNQLFAAVERANLKGVTAVIKAGANLNSRDETGYCPIHIAVRKDRHHIVALLLSRGAEVNARDETGWTPLRWAALEGGAEMVRFLISRGADAKAQTLKSWSIFPAGSTINEIAHGGRLLERRSTTE